ncbi:hypothetical protein [Herbaspirillum chlorophenolicum]|jgi:hypothetical protein|uniref:hypothetical protein n=1 Tax=Herbaspirillum chlorophenolicum TaxID=211589 RepID=UPI0012E2A053|nr:hypothetical protein [Herbaspirillum chlorophenolicum]
MFPNNRLMISRTWPSTATAKQDAQVASSSELKVLLAKKGGAEDTWHWKIKLILVMRPVDFSSEEKRFGYSTKSIKINYLTPFLQKFPESRPTLI